MNEIRIVARLDLRAGAIERLIGLLRRRRFPVQRIAISFTDDDAIEVVLRLDANTDGARLQAELNALEDVRHTETIEPASRRFTRELLLAWIRPDAGVHATGSARIVAVTDGRCLMEMTGTPEEIETMLTRLRERGVVSNSTRSEVAAPLPVPFIEERSNE